MKLAILWCIRAYQVSLSPLLPTSCRYEPSCSNYSHDAVNRYGVLKGALLGAKRLARCHPLGGKGYDPVP